MKHGLVLLLLLLCTPAIAQSSVVAPSSVSGITGIPEDADLYDVPHGMVLRGRLMSFSVMLGPHVRRLSSIRLRVGEPADVVGYENTPPGSLPALPISRVSNNQGIVLAAPRGSVLLSAGALLKNAPPAIAGRVFEGETLPYQGTTTSGDYSSGLTYDILFVDPMSGPGELFTFEAYVPLTALAPANPHTVSSVTYASPDLTVESANDPDGNAVALKTYSAPVASDIRPFGDVNGDGRLTQADAILILRSIVGLSSLVGAQTWYADIQPCSIDGRPLGNGRYLGDGSVNLKDARRILEVITGLWRGWWPDQESM